MPVDHLKKNLLTIHSTAKDCSDMWKRECDTAGRCISDLNKYKKTEIDREDALEVRLTERFSRKHPMFPVSLVKPYHKTGEDRFPSRDKSHNPQGIVEVENSTGPLKEIIKVRKITLHGKGHRQYLVRLKAQADDKDKCLAEDAIPDGELHLRRFKNPGVLNSPINDELFIGSICWPVTQNQGTCMTAKIP
ncbi:hypothetical protein O181_005776 [Austropuccinia psidii MF-1]|uniref:Uncharacterized protein n=1 Tax=Austropuccinia psidii MF-1 TaxID=1389203 RepID=A0A9Q3GG66_9BASI|nr:hypothetical protein [Austropuccinia psidii MF-1]